MVAPETPTITYGLKGLAYIEVWVRAASMDLHSGGYGGGVSGTFTGWRGACRYPFVTIGSIA